jgi:hypothetical protein
MAGQTRIVLYSWVRAVGARHHELGPDRLSTLTAQPSRGRDWAESRKIGAGLVGWRVLGANNRELGRSAGPFWRVDQAYQAVHEAQAVLERTVTRFWADDLGEWFWNISLDGEQLAVSSRGYRRQRECNYSIEQFREHFPTARVVASHVLRPPSTSCGSLVLPSVLVASPPGFVVGGPNIEVTA